MIKREQFNKWLDTFIEEKKLPNKDFEIDYAGFIHHFTSDQVIDLIRKAPSHEQKQIKDIIVKIDFKNGDINHFLKHLARGYIEINF
jgi:hypothetical protein